MEVVRFLFHDLLKLFNFRIPGTLTTPLGWAFFSLTLFAALRLVKAYFMDGPPPD